MNRNIYSLILDFFQISTILFIFGTGLLFVANILFIFQLLAILILCFAIWEMRRTRYYRIPDTGKQNELVTTGIYKHIRNPMYLAQLLFTGILVINSTNIFRVVAFVILFVTLLRKIQYEEKLLNQYFKEFEGYSKSSWKLIPYLY